MAGEQAQAEICQVHLDLFSGPMDLLLSQVKAEKLSILDISLALVTAQYLAYLDIPCLTNKGTANVGAAGDSLLIAATLMHYKSKMLLPVPVQEEDEEEMPFEGPSLQDLASLQDAARFLEERVWLDRDAFSRQGDWELVEMEGGQAEKDEAVTVGLFDLLESFRRIMANARKDEPYAITFSEASLADRINEIAAMLAAASSLTLTGIIGEDPTRIFIILTFLALLELVKGGQIRMRQEEFGGEIFLFTP